MRLAQVIERNRFKRTGTRPDWDNPRSYNDKINWLMVHDQRAEQIACCDKWAVRDWVALRAGPEILNDAWLGMDAKRLPCFAKCTHDSGSARQVETIADMRRAERKLGERLKRPYGREKGEWAYAYVRPQIICEAVLPDATDWKFHCVQGRVAWVQCIWGRETGPMEAIFTSEGELTGLLMDDHFTRGEREACEGWAKMVRAAEVLAAGFKYVRVDLYWAGKPVFGEMTFWPRAGCYGAEMQEKFGDLMPIDLTTKREAIVR